MKSCEVGVKRKRLKGRRVIGIAVGALLVWLAVPFPFLGEAGRSDVQEAAIRRVFQHNGSGLQDQLEVCFIGIGTSLDPSDDDFTPGEPSKEFVDRFSDLPVPALPISQSRNALPGGPGTVDSPDGGMFSHVTDATGRPGLIFAAGDVKRWSLGIVVCRGLYYEAGLSSAAYDILILRLPFAWIPVWSRMLWIS